jgi:hypothetical protein
MPLPANPLLSASSILYSILTLPFSHSILRSVCPLLVIPNVVRSLPILVTGDGAPTFLRKFGAYKSHTTYYPRRRHFSFTSLLFHTHCISTELLS